MVQKKIKEMAMLQKECLTIMELEPEGDTQKELVYQYLKNENLVENMKISK